MKKRWRTTKKLWEFLSGIGKKNFFIYIGNGGKFRPQNQVIESPAIAHINKITLLKKFTR